jgi:7-keto-8-aminopelargonate synthetase-like enzyme
MDLQKTYNVLEDKGTVGTALGIGGGALVLSQLLKSWGESQARAAMKSGIKVPKIHPAAAAGAGALLALLGREAYDKYQEHKQRQLMGY